MKLSKAFVKGFARTLDIAGKQKSRPSTHDGLGRDLRAIRGDWYNVGGYIKKGYNEYRSR